MKVSLNWMKWYGGVGLDVPINELVERIGAQLGAVEEVEDLGAKYQGVLIAKVASCVDHPDSDHLHVCMVDDGGKAQDVERDANGHVQVVCGAPNVREGLLVAWLPPGSAVPESIGKDPFVLGKRELRGVVSNGMIASPKELALGDSHDGILELGYEAPVPSHPERSEGSTSETDASALPQHDDMPKPGDDFAETYGLNDYIIDIENKMFTHRPDLFGQLGVAREIAGISGKQFTSPDWYRNTLQEVLNVDGENLPLEVRNELPSLVSRFLVVPLSNVTVRPSPVWLQTYLLRVGIRPINNVVDITNYMMLLTGQPMHAYDYDKVKALGGGVGCLIEVRNPKSNEEITLLNGKTIKPRPEAIMIATETKLIGVGGVMGGGETEVDEHTKNIILECANFDMYSIRRTAMAHGLFTDAVTRFNKGQSPIQNDEVSAKAVEMLRELTGAKVAGPVIDNNHVDEQARVRRWVHPPVPVTTDFINARLGFSLSAQEMQRLLGNVECDVTADGTNLLVHAPFWRTDIETREDVVEEVGRLYGFDKLPLELPKRSIQPAAKDPLLELKKQVRETLAKAGANEVLTYSFVHGDLLRKAGQNPDDAFQVANALSPDLQYYRLSLTPSLLDNVHLNIKAGYDEFALFEIGKAHLLGKLDEDGLPQEFERVALVYASAKQKGAAYFEARKYLLELLHRFGISEKVTFEQLDTSEADVATTYYANDRSATVRVGDKVLGRVGEYKASVRRALKLPDYCAGFEIGLPPLLEAEERKPYVPLSRFPRVQQDITLQFPLNIPHQEIINFFWEAYNDTQPEKVETTLNSLDIYQPNNEFKRVTLRFTIASYERTLTDQEVNKLLDDVAAAAKEKFGAERV